MDAIDPFARLADPKAEVRRCGKCGESALICFQAWAHSVNRISTSAVTRNCRCQACGRTATLRDPKGIRNVRIAAWVLVWTVIPAAVLFALAGIWRRAWVDNPLLPGAPFPLLRYQSGTRDRRCGACQQVARLTNITRHRHNGIPTGTTYQFVCEGCRRSFFTESRGGTALNLVFVLLFGGSGLAMLLSSSVQKKDLWIGFLCLFGGLAFVYISGKRLLAAWNNPEIETPHLMP